MFVSKKNVLNATLFSLLALSATSWAASDTATINVTATIVNNTCTPAWTTAGVNVQMNRVSAKDVGNDTGTANKSFTLNLSDCGDGAESVKVTAKGTQDTDNKLLFKNMEAGDTAAKGVGVSLWGGATQNVQLNPDGSNNVEYKIADKKADMTFMAKVNKTKAQGVEVGAGALKSVIVLDIAYQ